MHSFLRAALAALALSAGVVLWPGMTAAQEAPVGVGEARSAFTGTGFVVEPALSWDWTAPPVTTFRVRDLARERVLMVLVYPSMDAAELARSQGPYPVIGYGAASWYGNLAMVQSTPAELDRVYRLLSARTSGMSTDLSVLREPQPTTIAVDLDFLQALDGSVANL